MTAAVDETGAGRKSEAKTLPRRRAVRDRGARAAPRRITDLWCTGERLSLTVRKLKNFENSIKEYRRLYLEVRKIGESLFNLSKKIYRHILEGFRQSEKIDDCDMRNQKK